MTDQEYLDQAYFQQQIDDYLEKRRAHFCDEWGGLFIDKDSPEFECCTCFKE